jgi:nucleoside-diphosphate-sugar epimerase
MGQRVCVTGASGQAGRAVVRELREHGYDVVATDVAVTRSDLEGGMLRADLTDYGQALEALQGTEESWWPVTAGSERAVEALRGVDAVVHLANIPAPAISTPAVTFSANVTMNDYAQFPSFWGDPQARKWNLWGYVDERDVAAACRLALSVPADAVAGNPSFIVAAADTVMNRPSAELLREVFPEVPLTGEVSEFGTLLAIDRARHVLGFEPRHSWRDHVSVA